eukprot:c22212_g1_i1 orf=164-2236(+)
MASWFRAAEELFEVVDRRAKQVTDDLLVGGQNSAGDLGVFGRVLVTSPLTKGQSGSGKVSTDPSLQVNGNSTSYDFSNTTDTAVLAEDGVQDKKVSSSTEEKALDHLELLDVKTQNIAPVLVPDNTELVNGHDEPNKDRVWSKGSSDDSAGKPAEEGPAAEIEPVECKFATENGRVSVELIAKPSIVHESSSEKEQDAPVVDKVYPSEKVVSGFTTSSLENSLHEDQRPKEVPKLEEQLDEAQKLLKAASSSGQSKEARLARVCAGLSSRLQEYKSENTQLEALLQNEREENSNLRSKIKDIQLELASARAAVNSVESEMSSAFASKNAEIEALLSSLESLKKQAAHSEGKLAALQADMDVIARSRDLTENGMIQTLKEALEAAENRAEEEHLSHVATRKAAAQREAELEQCVADVTASLMRMQRTVDERTQKAAELEQKLSTLEMDCASLTQELQEAEAKLRKEQKRMLEDATQTSQIQAWREDADRARQAQRETEGRNLALEAENQKLRVELAALKREADQVSTQAQVELEKRFRELTEVLYLKQTQLEEMASEKAALVFQLEEGLNRSRQVQADAERHTKMQHPIAVWDDESAMKTLESLGLQKRRLVGTSIQKAVKFLDTGAVTAGRFLWRRPLARLGVLLYLVFVHAFLLYLLHRLQEQVLDSISSKEELEAAAAAGLLKISMRQ